MASWTSAVEVLTRPLRIKERGERSAAKAGGGFSMRRPLRVGKNLSKMVHSKELVDGSGAATAELYRDRGSWEQASLEGQVE